MRLGESDLAKLLVDCTPCHAEKTVRTKQIDNSQLNVGAVVSSITYYRLSAEAVRVINTL